VNFFMVYDIDIHKLNLEKNLKLKLFDEIPLKKMCFFVIFKIMNA
jgi:hypothetical protein